MEERTTTDALDEVLRTAKPEDVDAYLEQYAEHLAAEERPFADYMRRMLRARGLRQQDVFLRADLPERYGYKLIAQEKHTQQRDVILRLCLAAQFSLTETQRALKLYGFSPLYPRVPRDAVLIIAFNTGRYEIADVDELLLGRGMEPLYAVGAVE